MRDRFSLVMGCSGFRLTQEAAIGLVERWRRIRHPSIVSVREAFTTRAFGDHCKWCGRALVLSLQAPHSFCHCHSIAMPVPAIVFVYDYHPLSSTMLSEHMTPKPPQPDRRTGRLQPVQMQIPERVLWSYICQLASALRTIHANNMAARCVEPSKVLRTGKNRCVDSLTR